MVRSIERRSGIALSGCTAARIVGGTTALVLATACTREPTSWKCPRVEVGELVITELRGGQTGANTLPTWIEIANVGASALDLEGLQLRLRRPDQTIGLLAFVRSSRTLVAGDYFVLGFVLDSDPDPSVDYGLLDFIDVQMPMATSEEGDGDDGNDPPTPQLYPDGFVSLEACGVVIDEVEYLVLPKTGTWALGGEPDAIANDDPDAWCVDDRPLPEGANDLGIPGTPGGANPRCG